MSFREKIERVAAKITRNLVETKSGLVLPPAYVAGKHFGGIQGYEPWVRDCIHASVAMVRDDEGREIGPDELSEHTALALWLPGEPYVEVVPHRAVVPAVEALAALLGKELGCDLTVSDAAKLHIARADGRRQRGTILVVALRWWVPEGKTCLELTESVSAWNTATLEEALAVPRQEYLLG
jgi:hypothetical protein